MSYATLEFYGGGCNHPHLGKGCRKNSLVFQGLSGQYCQLSPMLLLLAGLVGINFH